MILVEHNKRANERGDLKWRAAKGENKVHSVMPFWGTSQDFSPCYDAVDDISPGSHGSWPGKAGRAGCGWRVAPGAYFEFVFESY